MSIAPLSVIALAVPAAAGAAFFLLNAMAREIVKVAGITVASAGRPSA